MRSAVLIMLAVLMLGLFPSPVAAGRIKLPGTYRLHQIKSACLAAQGDFMQGSSGSFGCFTQTGGIECWSNGTCIASCPQCLTRRPRQTAQSVLAAAE
jgi:hypothetical protein